MAARDSRLYELSTEAASEAAAASARSVLTALFFRQLLGRFQRFRRPLEDLLVLTELAGQRKAGDPVEAAVVGKRELADALVLDLPRLADAGPLVVDLHEPLRSLHHDARVDLGGAGLVFLERIGFELRERVSDFFL